MLYPCFKCSKHKTKESQLSVHVLLYNKFTMYLYGYPWYLDLNTDRRRLKKMATNPSPTMDRTETEIIAVHKIIFQSRKLHYCLYKLNCWCLHFGAKIKSGFNCRHESMFDKIGVFVIHCRFLHGVQCMCVEFCVACYMSSVDNSVDYFWPGCTKCIWLIEWWISSRHLLIGFLLCVINSSHTFRLTFFKPCTVVMDTLKMCMWLFGSVWTFFIKFTIHVVELIHFSSMFWIDGTYFV
jgi:hypothetical protein